MTCCLECYESADLCFYWTRRKKTSHLHSGQSNVWYLSQSLVLVNRLTVQVSCLLCVFLVEMHLFCRIEVFLPSATRWCSSISTSGPHETDERFILKTLCFSKSIHQSISISIPVKTVCCKEKTVTFFKIK